MCLWFYIDRSQALVVVPACIEEIVGTSSVSSDLNILIFPSTPSVPIYKSF